MKYITPGVEDGMCGVETHTTIRYRLLSLQSHRVILGNHTAIREVHHGIIGEITISVLASSLEAG